MKDTTANSLSTIRIPTTAAPQHKSLKSSSDPVWTSRVDPKRLRRDKHHHRLLRKPIRGSAVIVSHLRSGNPRRRTLSPRTLTPFASNRIVPDHWASWHVMAILWQCSVQASVCQKSLSCIPTWIYSNWTDNNVLGPETQRNSPCVAIHHEEDNNFFWGRHSTWKTTARFTDEWQGAFLGLLYDRHFRKV